VKSVATTWALYAVFGLLTLVTYSRLDGLYNVSREGIAGGASRTLVYLNFPVAFAAIGVLLLLGGWLAWAGIALCAVAAVPGVLDLDDLDARPINAVPALGVAVAVALTVLRRDRLSNNVLLADPLRWGLGVVLALISVPWLFAEAGFYAPDPIYSEEVPPGETLAAVHLGGHHGTYGVLLAVSALLLSRVARTALASGYLALMLAYGVALAAEDFWNEQVVKRGSVEWKLPSLIQPELEWGWLGILVAAAAVESRWFRREREVRSGRPVGSDGRTGEARAA
jgi:hypothetical protein